MADAISIALVLAVAAAGGTAGTVASLALEGKRSRVLFRERADGVHPDLQWLLDEWERDGTHTVLIAGGDDWPYPGGLRSDEKAQKAAHAAGLSNSSSLATTAHGRGAALDVWPEGFNPHRGFDGQPEMETRMRAFGAFAKQRGFVWGGDFQTREPDLPHVEIFNWRVLPYPPPDYRSANHA